MKTLPAMSVSANRFLATAFFLLFLSLPSEAARKARAIFIQPPDDPIASAILHTETRNDKIELPQRNLSPEVELPDGDLVVTVLDQVPPPKTPIDPSAPTFKIPAAWTRCILLFFPDPSSKSFPVRVIPVNASSDDFKMGHTLIYNVSPATVIGKFGEQIVRIAPGRTGTVNPPISGFGSYPVAIDCTYPASGEPVAICRSSWQHDPEARQILFITPNPGKKVPRIWGVLDRQEPITKKDSKGSEKAPG
ncbi:MAG: hypothetical protein ABI600_04005 [Luteolibacter sp.]